MVRLNLRGGGKRALMIYNMIQQEFDTSSDYSQLEETNETSDRDKVMTDTFKVILGIYILAPS
jgi:hypothetical protein